MKNRIMIRFKKAVLILCGVLLVTGGTVGLVRAYFMYKSINDSCEELRTLYIKEPEGECRVYPAGRGLSGDSVNTGDKNSESAELPTIDFKALTGRNTDVKGWIYIPDTAVSYPVLQGSTNAQYLYNDIDGNYTVSGSVILDSACGSDFSGKTVLYGHNMRNGSMFGELHRYEEEDFLNKHREVYIMLPDGRHEQYMVTNVQTVRISSDIYRVEENRDNNTLILSTCTADSSNEYRYVVICDRMGGPDK